MSATFPSVGFDARLWHRTGIGRYIRNIAPRLKGVDLVMWALPEDAATVQAEVPGALVRTCPAKPYSFHEMAFWRRELRRFPVDLFHAPHINIPLVSHVPLVVTLHDLIPLRFRGTINSWLGEKYFALMSALAVLRSARVIAVSESTRRDLVSLLQADPSKISVIREGADPRFSEPTSPERLAAIRQRFGLSGPYFIYAGQWKPHKNLDTLLKAFAVLRGRHAELRLVLVGREDPKQPRIPQLIHSLGLSQAVIRTGYLHDERELVGLFQGAAVLAHPARYEGFGLPPLEAMAAGVPVVASDAAAIPEVVGNAGILVPPDDVDQWVRALERAWLDVPLRRIMIAAGRERAGQFTWSRAAEETLASYHAVLQSPTMASSFTSAHVWPRWNGLRVPRSSFGT